MDRAYSLLEIKSVDGERRTFSGVVSTPALDAHGDIIEPLGINYRNPLPLRFEHKITVGEVCFDTPTAAGVNFTATIPKVTEPGIVKDLTDEAWHSVKYRLVRGASLGFEQASAVFTPLPTGGKRYLKVKAREMSVCTIAANQEATILTIKTLDQTRAQQAVSGQKAAHMKPTTGEHIQNLENKRASLVARMGEIMGTTADDGETLPAELATEHDGLSVQVKSIDGDLVRWRDLEKMQIATATPVVTEIKTISPYARVSVKPNVAPGTAFVRAACAQLVCKGNVRDAVDYAEKRWADSTPEVALYLKAAVAPGTVTDATWAAPLVNQNISNEFIELLRPATILGKIPGLRNVPFNTKVPTQTAGGTYGWVGESKPKPVTKLAFSSTSLSISKAAGIIVLTKELVMLSNPSAEALVRADMIAGIAQFLDQQFIDPAVAAVAGVNPASITNGAPTAAATTNPIADIMSLINHFATNNIAVGGVTFIMSAANALSLTFRTNLDGSPEFPGVTVNGGSYKGLTFITSQAAGTNVIALQPSLVLYADDGGVSIDASQEASLQMDSAPASPADATTVYVSLWQTNTIGLRAERFINWAKANANAVKYLTATAWPAPTGGVSATEANGRTKRAD